MNRTGGCWWIMRRLDGYSASSTQTIRMPARSHRSRSRAASSRPSVRAASNSEPWAGACPAAAFCTLPHSSSCSVTADQTTPGPRSQATRAACSSRVIPASLAARTDVRRDRRAHSHDKLAGELSSRYSGAAGVRSGMVLADPHRQVGGFLARYPVRPPSLRVTHSPLSVVATQTLTLRQATSPSSMLPSVAVTSVQDLPPLAVPSSALVPPLPPAQQWLASVHVME